ncbi:MAG: hypothetical protein GXP01_10515 [Alphaproteobacteria bacterium]|nr:hypothetical protein [Alphaproteobacteria bacterium]
MIRTIATLSSAALMAIAISSPMVLASQSGGSTTAKSDTMEMKSSHAHIGHVMTAWADTPDEMGFLPTAEAEAAIAIQHANLAAADTSNLSTMQLHATHVLNAVLPAMEMARPGLGYGVKEGAANTAKHITVAAGEDDASDDVKLHAVHVATAASNVVGWTADIADLVNQVQATTDVATAAALIEQLQAAANALVDGIDANNDGSVSWEEGEGGLAVARKHMEIMMAAEGMN